VVTAIDTNVLSALLMGTEAESTRALELLRRAAAEGELVISPIVYAELRAAPRGAEAEVMALLNALRIRVDWPMGEAVWHEAASAFRAYAERRRKRQGGEAKRFLPDFLVGAHALLAGGRLLSFDRGKYQAAFPELELLS
jgi:predicted nucleic acid-binding protein